MKNIYKVLFGISLSCVVTGSVLGQDVQKPMNIGSIPEVAGMFLQHVNKNVSMQLPSGKAIDVKIIDDQTTSQVFRVYGEVQNAKTSIFHIYGTEHSVNGKIVIDNKEGYEVSTDAKSGQVIITKVDVGQLICISPGKENVTAVNNQPQANKVQAQPALNSNPSAPFVLYLDFDGEYVNDSYWNSQMGGAKQCNGPNYSNAFITDVWAAISEDYRPYNINVSTERASFDAKSKAARHMVVYTNTWGSGGGVADIGSIANNGTDICWVFFNHLEQTVSDMAVTGAHESGHAFGLQHDGSTSDGNYWGGHGNYGAIMGNNYQTSGRAIWQWSKGEYAGATHHGGGQNYQDDVAIIAGNPGVGYRTDEHGDDINSATEIDVETDGTVMGSKNNGIITKRTDKDVFSFMTSGGSVSFNFQSGTGEWTNEADLDIQARLLDASGTEVTKSNPTGLQASISTTLQSGTYYIEIDGVGYGDPVTNGYSDYASLGYFEISGNYPPGSADVPPTIVSIDAADNCGEFTFEGVVQNAVDTYLWEFGDGGTSSSAVATHKYTQSGTHGETDRYQSVRFG
ncbi:MAG: pre-peptidase C-terminal domain-containing protein [Flavobacteriales bacterium]|nr:pre-peptidase C-terminal domain-containing protein [Flavobacteriales bacterium]